MKTVINVKTDEDVKKEAKKIAADLGLSLSAIVNAYLKQFVRNKEVYFSTVSKMSPELEKLLGRIEFDIKNNRNISKPIFSKKGLDSHLASL
ncbi:MAG: DUF6364 family protein [Patescibacteria group bacterium]